MVHIIGKLSDHRRRFLLLCWFWNFILNWFRFFQALTLLELVLRFVTTSDIQSIQRRLNRFANELIFWIFVRALIRWHLLCSISCSETTPILTSTARESLIDLPTKSSFGFFFRALMQSHLICRLLYRSQMRSTRRIWKKMLLQSHPSLLFSNQWLAQPILQSSN